MISESNVLDDCPERERRFKRPRPATPRRARARRPFASWTLDERRLVDADLGFFDDILDLRLAQADKAVLEEQVRNDRIRAALAESDARLTQKEAERDQVRRDVEDYRQTGAIAESLRPQVENEIKRRLAIAAAKERRLVRSALDLSPFEAAEAAGFELHEVRVVGRTAFVTHKTEVSEEVAPPPAAPSATAMRARAAASIDYYLFDAPSSFGGGGKAFALSHCANGAVAAQPSGP